MPRAKEILQLTAKIRQGIGPLDRAENRLRFVQQLRDYLRSPPFSYTMNPPRIISGEPIGEFLLTSKTGNCEYFAAAMALEPSTAARPWKWRYSRRTARRGR